MKQTQQWIQEIQEYGGASNLGILCSTHLKWTLLVFSKTGFSGTKIFPKTWKYQVRHRDLKKGMEPWVRHGDL